MLTLGGVDDWMDELEGSELSAEAAAVLSEHLVQPRPAEQLLEMCDSELVPESGQREWANTLRQLGGEYSVIAQLAHAHEAQCMQLMGHDIDDDDDSDDWDEDRPSR